jgi:LmbE family N-acetylglucosaminyl deacetylase
MSASADSSSDRTDASITRGETSENDPGQPPTTRSRAEQDITSVDLPTPAIALAVGAHPDDIEFGCGGTLAKWAQAGCLVHHLVLTDGSKGTWNPDADIQALVSTRREEQREAARRLGAEGEVVFFDQIDGDLEATRELRSRLAREIRRLKPTVVLGHDPWKRYRLHPDHRAAGFLLCDAVVAARDPHFFREHGMAHHRPTHMLLWEADEPDHAEDIGSVVDTKISALLAHGSQFESTMKAVDPADLEAFTQRIRQRISDLGTRVARPGAEFFKRISDI